MKAVNIKWDIDNDEYDEKLNLPAEIEIPDEILEELEDNEDAISDYLSDVTGFCHCGFELVKSQNKTAKIIEEKCIDFRGKESVALSLDKDELYTISEFIELLEEAKKRFGNKKILIHDINSNILGGFSHVYLNHGFDEREK